MEIKIDLDINKLTKDFEKKLDDALVYSLTATGYKILLESEKFIPIDRGDLVGSGGIAVNKKMIQLGSQAELSPDLSNMAEYELRVSSNMKYSHKIHEEYNKMKVGVKSAQKFGVKAGEPQGTFGWKFLVKGIDSFNVIQFITDKINERLAK